MRRLLISTTALSVALGSVNPWPLMAQSVAEDGSIIANDGSILCLQTEENPCNIEDYIGAATDDAAAAEAEQQAAEEAAAAEAAAQAEAEQQAAEEAAAAEAAAQAEAEQQAAEEAAAAEAAAQAEAEQQAAEEAAAAEAAAQAEAEQQAAEEAAAAEAAAQAEAEQQAAEEAAAEEPAAEEPVADEAATEDAATVEEDPALGDAMETLLSDEAPAEDAVTEEAPADEAPAEEAPAESADGTDAASEPAEEVVISEPTEETVETLTDLLADPVAEDPAALGAAAALADTAAPVEGEPLDLAPAAGAEVTVQQVTEEDARSSSEEFATKAAEGDTRSETQRTRTSRERAKDDDGLSDLEKAGLVALGALVVGSIISANRDRVVANTGDRVVVERGTGDYVVYKDDDTLLRRPGSTVRTETFRDGSTRTIVERADGTQVVTIRDATGRVLRRATYDSLGREIVLFDDLVPEEAIDVTTLPRPVGRVISIAGPQEDALLKARMAALDAEELGRTFSLRQIRELREVRQLAATIDVNNITFDSGSSAIKATEAEELAALGRFITAMIRENPREMFLIEGHTDAVGSAASNLALSDRRAESVALALTEYFEVPPENMVVQGYGESELRVDTQADERQNRRVAVRVITPLLQTALR